MNQTVDNLFTRYNESKDNSKFNIVQPKKNQLYLGWIEIGKGPNILLMLKNLAFIKFGTCTSQMKTDKFLWNLIIVITQII